jgi:cyclopropane fatty-acyl-phospholipid synthase-like methyltransferase
LKKYFSKHWTHDTSYKYSWESLIDKVNALKPNSVLDVGCGFNYFKGKIDNLYGIDPYNDKADKMCGIEEFGVYRKYDVIIALGSINFGDENTIDRQMRAVDTLLNSDGHLYMRLNPGLVHHWDEESDDVDFYPWTKEKIKRFALAYGYVLEEWEEDPNSHGSMRYYTHLIKL